MARYMRGYGQYKLGDPIVGAGISWHGPGVYLRAPFSGNDINRRKASYQLGPPMVIFGPPINPGLRIKLTSPYRGENSTNRRVHSRLSPPRVVTSSQVFTGPKVWQVTKRNVIDYGTRRAPIAFIEEPVIPPLAEPLRITLAPQLRTTPKSRLFPPAVVGAGAVNPGLRIKLTFGSRGVAKSRLFPPVGGIAQVSYGPQVTLAPSRRPRTRPTFIYPIVVFRGDAFGYVAVQYVRRPTPTTRSRLFSPAVVTPVVAVYYGPKVTLARSRRGQPKSFLRAPAILASNLPTVTTLAPQRRGQAKSRLFPPRVVFLAVEIYGPEVHLTRIKPQPTVSVLRPPADITEAQEFPVVAVHRTYARRGRPVYFLRPFTARAFEVSYGPQVALTPSRRPITKSKLSPPVVVAPVVSYGPLEWLAYSRRGTPKSRLQPPAVVFQPPAFAPLEIIWLAPSRRPVTRYILRSPAVVGAGAVNPGLRIKLTFGRRPVTKSRLTPSLVAAVVYYGPSVTLTPSRRPRVSSTLNPPTVLAVAAAGQLQVNLTYSRRPKVLSGLEKPAVIEQAEGPQGGVLVSLAPQSRGKAKSFLKPPAVVAATAVVYYGPQVTLAYSRRGRPVHFLRLPVIPPLARAIRITLASSRRGRPTYFLRPEPIGAFNIYFAPAVTLAPSRRPIIKSRLRPPAVVAPVVSYGPFQWLTYSRRGTPKPFLKPPTVVQQPPAYQQVVPPVLTYSRRGRPIYKLRPPTRVFPVLFFGPQVTLRPQVRGIPKPFLRPPTVVRLAVEIYGPKVWLTYSRRPKTRSELLPPTVVEPFFARPRVTLLARIKHPPVEYRLRPAVVVRLAVEIYGPAVELTYSRRPQTRSRLLPPAVVGRAPFRGLLTHLTYSRRGRPINFRLPEVAGQPPFRGLLIHLTRIKHPPVQSVLEPPAVTGAGVAFYGPQITLVRIKHPPVKYKLRLTLVAFRRPHGHVCGFDIAGSFVCHLEVPGTQASGGTSSGHQISGSSRAGSRVAGSENAGGSVSGSDRKAT